MRIAAYCRVSTDKEEQLESLKNQKEYFTEYAEKNGHILIKLYADEGISGKQKNNRIQFMNMIADAKEHIFDMIITKDISRFARNTVDALTTIRELKEFGIEVLFLTNNQTILGNSEFIITLFSALAQEESANLSKRVKFGKNKAAENGIVPPFIYGYNRVNKYKLEINEQQVDTVRKIFDLYANNGYGCSKITNYLIDNNIPSYKGLPKYWNTKTVRRILRNEIYIGIVSNNKSEVIDFLTGKSINKNPDEWYKKEYPEIAVIEKELFIKAQRLFDNRQELYMNKSPNGRFCDKYIFSGIIKCTHCGRSFTRKSYTYKNTRIFWICPANDQHSVRKCINNFRINEDDIINYLKEYFDEILKDKNKYIESYILE
ncbi:MAG: recombinase family protein, partial [Oscillospiraceae bacterium]|nr:recombinase family protein [Oscillospiraceae bacterium]